MTTLNYKKVLLVHPLGYKADAAAGDIARMANLMPPLGLLSIAAYLVKHGLEPTIIDFNSQPHSEKKLIEYLRDHRPGFLGMSCTTSSFLDGVRIASLARRELCGIKAVVGGPHVSALKELLLDDFPQLDYLVVGEGEQTFLELVQREGKKTDYIKGLAFRSHDGSTTFTGYREKGLILDELPFPAYDLLPGFPENYRLPVFSYPRQPGTTCVTSRGCPHACTYCDRSVFRRTYRYNSAGYIYEHLRYLRDRFHIRHVNFYDDQFLLNRERIKELAVMIANRPLKMTFNCAARAEHINKEILAQLKASGCWMISIGIESGDPEILAQHRGKTDLGVIADRILMIKKAGLRTKGLVMIGLPGESRDSVRKSMKYVHALPLDELNVTKFTPFPGSPLYQRINGCGTFTEEWPKMDCMQFLFIPEGMTLEELETLFHRFYRKHFMRPRTLWNYTKMAWQSPDSWRRFAGNLGSFVSFALTDRRWKNE